MNKDTKFMWGLFVALFVVVMWLANSGCAGTPIAEEWGTSAVIDGELQIGDQVAQVHLEHRCTFTPGESKRCTQLGGLHFDGSIRVMPWFRIAGTMYAPSLSLGLGVEPGTAEWEARGCVLLGPMGLCPVEESGDWEIGDDG
jgi:hypothetical protein